MVDILDQVNFVRVFQDFPLIKFYKILLNIAVPPRNLLDPIFHLDFLFVGVDSVDEAELDLDDELKQERKMFI